MTSTVIRTGAPGPRGGFLERFRRSPGIPAAVGDDAPAELAPVFAALDKYEREAAAVRAQSEREATRRLHRARDEATAIAADARGLADAERDDALRAGRRAADAAVAEIVVLAEQEAQAIERRGEKRLPQLVAEVVARVRETGS